MTRSRWLAWAVVAAAIALVVHAAVQRGGVIVDNRLFAARVLAGEFPYADRLHTPYPPSYGFVMAPLLLFSEGLSRIVWATLQVAMLWLLWRQLRPTLMTGMVRTARLSFLVALLLVSRFLLRDTKAGGGNLVFGVLALLPCLAHVERPALGAGLGLVLAAKPTPVLFVPWLLLRGRWRTAVVTVVSAALLHALPLLTLGVDGYGRAYGRWLEGSWLFSTQADVFAEPALEFPRFSWMNQALRCAVARFLGDVPAALAAQVPGFVPGAGLAAEHVTLVTRSLAMVLLAVTFGVLWRRRAVGGRALEALALLLPITLLLSPITWKAHHVQLLPAIFVLVASGVSWWRLLVYYVACNLLSREVVGDRGEELLQSCYLVTFGAVWVWWEGLRVVRRRRRHAASL